MVNELRDLLREASDQPPQDALDLAPVLRTARRRVRVRRLSILGGTALATAAAVTATAFVVDPDPVSLEAAGVPRPEGPVLRLADAQQAEEGRDYRVLTSHTNKNLDSDNGQYLDGMTEDGLLLFRDGPRREQRRPRYALVDPGTGEKDWLPDPGLGQSQVLPVELSEDRLVLLGQDESGAMSDTMSFPLVGHVYDRTAERWSELRWSDLPPADLFRSTEVGPDGRLYVLAPATRGKAPEGGWPTGPDGEADDADAEGDTFDLWSVSLTDPTDVRPEGVRLGALAFTEEAMVWTDSANGAAGMVHVRDLATGEETAFDPRTGERCNLLGFAAALDRIVMSQYCGTYEDGVRDDRVQVLSTDGDLVTTLQGSDIESRGEVGPRSRVVTIASYEPAREGTYVYDLRTDRLLRVSDAMSSWSFSGPVLPGQFMWNTPENFGRGTTQHVGELLD